MPKILLNRPTPPHEPHCVCSFACWWREMLELELAMEYRRSSPEARALWDGILGTQIPHPNPSVHEELRLCVRLWSERAPEGSQQCGTLLDALVCNARQDGLELPRFAALAALHLRQRLGRGINPLVIGTPKKAAG